MKTVMWILVVAVALMLSLALTAGAAAGDGMAPLVGPILDMDPSTNGQSSPDVAWNQACDKFLVVYDRQIAATNLDIYGRYVNGDAVTIGAGPFQITPNNLNQKTPAVATNPGGGGYVVVWQDHRNGVWEIWAQRVGCQKNLIGAPVRMTAAAVTKDQTNPDVVCWYVNGNAGCWVVWQDFRNGDWDIYGQKLTAGGALSGANVQITSRAGHQRNPAIAANTENTGCTLLGSFMVAWDDTRNSPAGLATDIYLRQLNDITVCGGIMMLYSGAGGQTNPDLAYGLTDNRYQVVWQDTRAGNEDIYARMTNANGGVIGAALALVNLAPSNQGRPAIAYDAAFANQFATVWHDNRPGNYQIIGQRTSGLGALVGANFAVVVTANPEMYPAIAWGNISHHYHVDWDQATTGIEGRGYWP